MSETTDIFSPDESATVLNAIGESSFLITAIDVFNWGPFHGRHHCAIDSYGTAIIGPTGSGKTTLVDALMTLLAPFPKYNLASTGGHESDRDLISYVRGVSGVENAQAENSHVARPSKTLTGLSSSYFDGNHSITIGCLLWVEGSSNAAEDLKKVWFFSRDIPDVLDNLLTLFHDGGKASISRYARDTVGLRLFPSKKEYLSHIRSFFEVGENAFSLLNRAAGLKQINSIDQIFRELVLDDRSAFGRAAEVAREFDTLHGIYEELQIARRQRDSLIPVEQGKVEWEKFTEQLKLQRHLKELLPIWIAEASIQLLQAEDKRLTDEKEEVIAQLHSSQVEMDACERRVQTLNEEYLRHGGAAIQEIEEIIRIKEKFTSQLRTSANNYALSVAKLSLPNETDAATFHKNKLQLPEIKAAALLSHENARQRSVDIAAKIIQHKETEERLKIEIDKVKDRPNSNIPAPFQAFRDMLAQELSVSEAELPFVAEMVEVKITERHWQGAIERAIGPERLRILVPSHRMSEALAWINSRDNRLHVRLQSADLSPIEARCFDDGFIQKLNFRDHPLRGQTKQLLARRDRHCVDSVELLRRIEHAMTVEGTMSDRDGRFEKQDQKHISADWMTGFDNRHLLTSLESQRQQSSENILRLDSENTIHRRLENNASQKISLIEQLEVLEFSQIDVVSSENELHQQRQRLAELTRPDSDANNAKCRHENATSDFKLIRARNSELLEKQGSLKTKIEKTSDELQQAQSLRGDGLSEDDANLIEKEFSLTEILNTNQLNKAERAFNQNLEIKIQDTDSEVTTAEKNLVRRMSEAKNIDTGHLLEAGTELCDIDAYLQRLETLRKESLPEKLKRFLDYLNESSGQGVTQLLTSIGNEVALIQERVTDLNATLSRVDFRQGQFLQLHAQTISHPSLQQMETAQRKLRHIVLSQRDDEGESHYRALGDVVRLLREAAEKHHTLGAQALLDPRHRLQFSVVEVDRATGNSSGGRKGSQTGSGGEKEMMASYILTASLSYALCPVGATAPRYASIVLDEAFSKSSPTAAARIIEALRAFGLHPLFVTPNKEIALLKSHTRSAILVHNKNKRATLTCLTWEEIDSHARSRKASEEGELNTQ